MQHESARRPQVQGRREEGGFEAVSVGVSAAVAATPVWGLGVVFSWGGTGGVGRQDGPSEICRFSRGDGTDIGEMDFEVRR